MKATASSEQASSEHESYQLMMVHMEFDISSFNKVEVDERRKILTIHATTVSGRMFREEFQAQLERLIGRDAAARIGDDAAHMILKRTILEQLSR